MLKLNIRSYDYICFSERIEMTSGDDDHNILKCSHNVMLEVKTQSPFGQKSMSSLEHVGHDFVHRTSEKRMFSTHTHTHTMFHHKSTGSAFPDARGRVKSDEGTLQPQQCDADNERLAEADGAPISTQCRPAASPTVEPLPLTPSRALSSLSA